jgi:hypothetical protein
VPLGLRPGVSFCEASGHLVFLDIEADRYFGLASAAEAAFRSLLRQQPQQALGQSTDALIETRLLVVRPDALPIRACPEPAPVRASLLDRRLPSAPVFAIVRALAGIMAARLALRVGGLAMPLRTLTGGKSRITARASDRAKIESEVAAFHRCALLVRSHDQCLVRSLALMRGLAARGESADLVIGVRVRPFSAHAWVQKGDLLLNESCDGVRGYTPILIV